MFTLKSPLRLSLLLPLLAGTAFPCFAEPAASADVDALMQAVNEQARRLAAQEEILQKQKQDIERQQRSLDAEKERFRQLSGKVSALTGKPVDQTVAAAPVARVTDAATPPAAANTNTPQEVGTVRKEEKEQPPQLAAYIEEGGVLLQKGKLVVTPAVEYQNSSATRVAISGFSIIPAINVGLFEVTQVTRNILTPSVGVRYGVTNRFEVEAKVPYVYRTDDTLTRPVGASTAPTLTNATGHDIGDVEFGAHYQLNRGKDGWPYLIGNVRVKTTTGTSPFDVPLNAQGLQTELPTGSGFWAVQPSVTAIFPSDPVVYYGNVGYLHNFGKDVGGVYGEIDPGDSISASFGMSLSLNDRASMSLGYSHNTVLETRQNGLAIPNSQILQIGSVDLGYSYNLSDRTNLNFTVSAGVTEDAPDVRLAMRVPMSFDLNK